MRKRKFQTKVVVVTDDIKCTRNMKVTIIIFCFCKIKLGSAKQRDSKRENKRQRRYVFLIHVSITIMDV
jgi:hypothetical protein